MALNVMNGNEFWAAIGLMGHRHIIGTMSHVEPLTWAIRKLRNDGELGRPVFFQHSAIFSFEPMPEAEARERNEKHRVAMKAAREELPF